MGSTTKSNPPPHGDLPPYTETDPTTPAPTKLLATIHGDIHYFLSHTRLAPKAELYIFPAAGAPPSDGWCLSWADPCAPDGTIVHQVAVEGPEPYQNDNVKEEDGSSGTIVRAEEARRKQGLLWWEQEEWAGRMIGVVREMALAHAVAETAWVTVRAERMAFRRENEFGLWESTAGWTLVVAVAR